MLLVVTSLLALEIKGMWCGLFSKAINGQRQEIRSIAFMVRAAVLVNGTGEILILTFLMIFDIAHTHHFNSTYPLSFTNVAYHGTFPPSFANCE